MKLSKKLLNRIVEYYQESYGGVIPNDYSFLDFAKHRIASAKSQISRLKSLRVKRQDVCLDAGCGIGTFCVLANLSGYNYYGYEIDPNAYEIARAMMKENGLDPKRITFLPPKRKFDFVSSFEVVEHVKDLNEYFAGVKKLIKKEGRFFMEMPNYLLPYEPHFYVFMPPLVPKIIKWWSVYHRFSGNKKFFDELNFVTPWYVERLLKKNDFCFENLGQQEWLKDIKCRSVYIKFLAHLSIMKVTAKLGIYTPLIYLAKPIL